MSVSALSPGRWRAAVSIPLPLLLILAGLALAFAGGLTAADTVAAFNQGYGRALGEFALLLIPSFILAACLARAETGGTGRIAALAAPLAGAGMVCPDTAYAALSPLAGPHRLRLAFGAFAGFKLLLPAGPLIVATGLGAGGHRLLPLGLLLLAAAWAAGEVWLRFAAPPAAAPETRARSGSPWTVAAPFLILIGLLTAGAALGTTGLAPLDFLLSPKGALIAASVQALIATAPGQRRECQTAGLKRAGDLLLVIGAAGGFAAILTRVVPVADLAAQWLRPDAVLLTLFVTAAAFKAVQGSSMATFAAVAPVTAPLIAASGADPVAAVYAICLGSFVAILPNDSFYWLVRRDALAADGERRAAFVLAGGSVVQALAGLAVLLLIA
jgi:gluconate:H+ symporter, GntP family